MPAASCEAGVIIYRVLAGSARGTTLVYVFAAFSSASGRVRAVFGRPLPVTRNVNMDLAAKSAASRRCTGSRLSTAKPTDGDFAPHNG
jgi:hypothetical protein